MEATLPTFRRRVARRQARTQRLAKRSEFLRRNKSVKSLGKNGDKTTGVESSSMGFGCRAYSPAETDFQGNAISISDQSRRERLGLQPFQQPLPFQPQVALPLG